MKKIILTLIVTCFLAIGCKQEPKKQNSNSKIEIAKENIQNAAFAISGMSCEIGCAKHITAKLSKLDGVIEANVIFADSIAKVKFDKTKTDSKKLMSFINGMANNKYKASEKSSETEVRPIGCNCEGCKGKKQCAESCKNKCNTKKRACKNNCEKSCCQGKEAKATT